MSALAIAVGGSPNVLEPAGDEASRIADIWWLMFGLAAFVYVVVAGLVIWAALRGGDADNSRGDTTGRRRDRWLLWVGGIGAPVVILALLGIVTVDASTDLREPKDDALEIEVVAQDWWWEVRYPEEGIVTANEIHLPVDRPIEITLTSTDVIHSFWVPELAGKLDAVPGQPNVLTFTATEPGRYRGVCAEFCGIQHSNMGVLVFAESSRDFGQWVARRTRPPGPPVGELEATGRRLFERLACAGCHTVRGTAAEGQIGPSLSDLGARATLGAVTLENTPENLRAWISDPGEFKPGALMPAFGSQLSDGEIDAIAAYLESLG